MRVKKARRVRRHSENAYSSSGSSNSSDDVPCSVEASCAEAGELCVDVRSTQHAPSLDHGTEHGLHVNLCPDVRPKSQLGNVHTLSDEESSQEDEVTYLKRKPAKLSKKSDSMTSDYASQGTSLDSQRSEPASPEATVPEVKVSPREAESLTSLGSSVSAPDSGLPDQSVGGRREHIKPRTLTVVLTDKRGNRHTFQVKPGTSEVEVEENCRKQAKVWEKKLGMKGFTLEKAGDSDYHITYTS